jgi:hypothetical protein
MVCVFIVVVSFLYFCLRFSSVLTGCVPHITIETLSGLSWLTIGTLSGLSWQLRASSCGAFHKNFLRPALADVVRTMSAHHQPSTVTTNNQSYASNTQPYYYSFKTTQPILTIRDDLGDLLLDNENSNNGILENGGQEAI